MVPRTIFRNCFSSLGMFTSWRCWAMDHSNIFLPTTSVWDILCPALHAKWVFRNTSHDKCCSKSMQQKILKNVYCLPWQYQHCVSLRPPLLLFCSIWHCNVYKPFTNNLFGMFHSELNIGKVHRIQNIWVNVLSATYIIGKNTENTIRWNGIIIISTCLLSRFCIYI